MMKFLGFVERKMIIISRKNERESQTKQKKNIKK